MRSRLSTTAPRLFCSKPFTNLEVGLFPARGTAYLCCPAWLPFHIGTVGKDSVQEIWNGSAAQKIRRSILDGSFSHCNNNCPHLQTVSGPVQTVDSITDETLAEIVREQRTTIPHPKVVNAGFDQSCNLSCPSCRQKRIIEEKAEDRIRSLQSAIELEALADAEILYITGSGDAFGSPYFLSWLRKMKVSDKPKLQIHLHTNAQLWTPPRWAKIPQDVRDRITSAEISIDAASAGTYLLNRRGGDWDTLLHNLRFIAGLRAQGALRHLKFHMLVQENNFVEMPEFVRLGKSHGADQVYFSHLVDWGTFRRKELLARSIHLPDHPRHAELLGVLADPTLTDPVVDLGNLTDVKTPRAPSAAGSGAGHKATAPMDWRLRMVKLLLGRWRYLINR
jgi:hypothetical protein